MSQGRELIPLTTPLSNHLTPAPPLTTTLPLILKDDMLLLSTHSVDKENTEIVYAVITLGK